MKTYRFSCITWDNARVSQDHKHRDDRAAREHAERAVAAGEFASIAVRHGDVLIHTATPTIPAVAAYNATDEARIAEAYAAALEAEMDAAD